MTSSLSSLNQLQPLAAENRYSDFDLPENTREPEMRPAGVEFKYTSVGPESNPRLPFDRFDFSDESLVIVRKERK